MKSLPQSTIPSSTLKFEETASARGIHHKPADHVPKEELRELIVRFTPPAAVEYQLLNPDLEATLAHERLVQIQPIDELGQFYGQLYTASPIPPFQIDPSQYLAHLYEAGQTILIGRGTDQLCLWESEFSPEVPLHSTTFFTFPVDVDRIRKANAREGDSNLTEVFVEYPFATAAFSDNDVGELFEGIIAGGGPVASVMSIGDHHTEVLFRVTAASKSAWKAECKALAERIEEFCSPPRMKFESPASLPNVHSSQRLIYLAPAG